MKKSIFSTLALAALLFVGAPEAQAQKGYDVPEVSPELTALADEVIDLQLSDPDKANKQFTKLMRKIQKNKENLLGVGQYFLEKNVYPCANQCAKTLYTLDPTYIPGLMFNGEVCMLRKDYGSAGQKFDEVLSVDSTYVPALKRNAFVYKNVNPHVAIEMLQRIKNVEPDNHTADRDLGDIYYNLSEYTDAVKTYKAYFTTVTNNDSTDIRSAENYVQSLYATQDFETLGTSAVRFGELDSKDMVFKRMKFFADVENYDMASAKNSMAYIANQEYPDSFYLYLDYSYAGNFMDQAGDIPAAIGYYEKAVQTDSTKASGLKQLANLYRRNSQTDEGLTTYKKYLTALGDKVQPRDRLMLVSQYAGAASQKGISEEVRAGYVSEGEKIVAEILAAQPDAYQAVLFQARLNITDGNKPEDKVKELYEKALQMMEGKENTNNAKIEAYRYIAFYCVQKDLLDDARKYTNGILSIDAENSFAKQIDAYLKSEGK